MSGDISVPISFIDQRYDRPRTSFFLRANKGQPETSKVLVKVNQEEPIKVLGAQSSNKYLTTQLNTVEEGREYELILELTEDAPVGRQIAHVVVTTSSEERPEIKLTVSAFVADPAAASAIRKPQTTQ